MNGVIQDLSSFAASGSSSNNSFTAIPGILDWVWKIGRGLINQYSKKGMYEVLDFQTKLTIQDAKGRKATLTKYEKVRFLQDNIIAYQDQAWGDGNILQNYKCTPGVPVDIHRTGHKTYVLVSLRAVKNKGDVVEFNSTWKIKNGFLKNTGFWGTDINHTTSHVKVQVEFPKSRPPQKASIFETDGQKEKSLEKGVSLLPNQCTQVSWDKDNPRLYEHYILKWSW
jgi:hypothetical protein